MSKLFSFRLPPVLNEQIDAARAHRQIGAGQKKNWTETIRQSALNQNPERCQFERVWIATEFVVRTHGYDPDGLAATMKFILDGLVAAGVLRNDNLTVVQSPTIEFFSVDTALKKTEQYVNILLSVTAPTDTSFAGLVKQAGLLPGEEEEDDCCA